MPGLARWAIFQFCFALRRYDAVDTIVVEPTQSRQRIGPILTRSAAAKSAGGVE
jgi:hypothetical protein